MRQFSPLLILVGLVTLACQTVRPNQDRSTLLADSPPVGTSDRVKKSPQRPAPLVPHHCEGLAPDVNCFTVYLKIPRETMVADFGLSVLALAAQSKTLGPFVQESCRQGVSAFFARELKLRVIPHIIRGAFVRQKSIVQCVIIPLNSFAEENEPITLHPKERAIAVRLTRYEIEGKSTQINLSMLRFHKNDTRTLLRFRDVTLGAGHLLQGETPGQWQFLADLGPNPQTLTSVFERELNLKINETILKKNLASLKQQSETSSNPALQSFFNQAAASMAPTPETAGGLLMLNMGLDFIKRICFDAQGSRDPELCGSVSKSSLKTGEIFRSIELPSAENSELLRSSIIHLTADLINWIFVKGDGHKIRRVFAF